ncbi:hypothetical protein CC78DRAFT_545079 [Lojkania enalia]|uniref:Sister chromatid cohesion protein Dcc1 n=1 Tax=Lojkania enalia TaxID=147567 RepID=A0A9P4KB98_9PLEO|nr:hypothetical protein CC78DRAFT_545079 [Didymosphaeria enalia]
MATQQAEGGVPFSMVHNMQQFRLLELPAELLELIDTPNPPPLSIKSQAPSTVYGAPNTKPAYAVLCTPDKTFQLRQVQTSNSVLIARPALEAHGNEMPCPTTCAIASCTATLELHPADASAVAYLEEALLVYDIVDGDADTAGNGKTKTDTFSNVPLSDEQCESGWGDLLAFEFVGSCWRPSANTLSQVWKSINAAATAEGVRLDQQFLAEDILNHVRDEGFPATLVLGILQRLASDGQDRKGPWSCLHRTKTVQFVGRTLLEAKRGSADYLTAEFLDTWKDNLPESWRGYAELNAIEGSFDLPSPTTIRFKNGSGAANESKPSAPKAGSSSRKWHERFGRARNG